MSTTKARTSAGTNKHNAVHTHQKRVGNTTECVCMSKTSCMQVAVQSVGLCGSDLAYWAHGVAGGVFPIDFPGSTTTGVSIHAQQQQQQQQKSKATSAPNSSLHGTQYKGQMGHEVAGTVVALGDGVTSLKLGDHVALEAGVPCRECVYCKIGRYNLCPKVCVGARSSGCRGVAAPILTAVTLITDQVYRLLCQCRAWCLDRALQP